ncbi:SHOCT domain-containing protein [Synechococcus sp. J7-Johnson]|nr:SHOCT domain-containing protein [Synechococcus sp. J7-Johnson]
MSAGSHQAQSSGTGSQQQSSVAGQQAFQAMQPIQPTPCWWPAELGTPNASGSQDEVRYAYFSEPGRLAVDLNGTVNLYDVQDQPITGLAQGSSKGDPVFVTPEGLLSLSSLRPVAATPERPGGTAVSGEADVLSALERLGELKQKGILTDEEFTAKKTELLSRL